jgi:uncharacterized surface protein with fasciclin (FAS1) repeats
MVIGFSCEDIETEASFQDTFDLSILDYLMENEEDFSSFISILKKGEIDKTLSSLNPHGDGYTLFAPDNEAINRFINESDQFSSLNDLLNDTEFVKAFSRYHVLNMRVRTNEFPFGAFPQPTLSKDFLTVSFINEADSSYYKINNQAAVTKANMETLNGYVHHIETALKPITSTSYQLLEQNPALSIFKEAVDLTGLRPVVDFDLKQLENSTPVTLLVEPNSVFQKAGINSIQDLTSLISPNNKDFTNPSNPFYNYVAYHILQGRFYVDDFVDNNTNYTTFSDIPLNVNGLGLDIVINRGTEVFDTIVYQGDSTFINYATFLYDESNVISKSGVIHHVDHLVKQQKPIRALATYMFYEEPVINTFSLESGTYLIENQDLLKRISWTGVDLYYVAKDEGSSADRKDYLMINSGSSIFSISYTIPKIVQGRYQVIFRAHSYSSSNAVVEVFIDGKKLGSMVDLTSGGSAQSPFQGIVLGTSEFKNYKEHKVEIRSLIPGRLLWDYIQFKPY